MSYKVLYKNIHVCKIKLSVVCEIIVNVAYTIAQKTFVGGCARVTFGDSGDIMTTQNGHLPIAHVYPRPKGGNNMTMSSENTQIANQTQYFVK